MSDLVEFLLARIAEDAASARAASPGPWRVEDCEDGDMLFIGNESDPVPICSQETSSSGGWRYRQTEPNMHFIGRHDPDRVLAECEAKRRIIDAYREFVEPDPEVGFAQFADDTPEDRTWPEYGGGMFSGLRQAVRALAAVYADHPDYRDEWRPTA